MNSVKNIPPIAVQKPILCLLPKHLPAFPPTTKYLMGHYNASPNLTPAPLTPALITSVSNCAEYKKVFISAFNGNICQKIS